MSAPWKSAYSAPLILLLLLLGTSCDAIGVEDPDSFVGGTLVASFFERTSAGAPSAIDSFRVGSVPSVSLDRAQTVPLHSEAIGGAANISVAQTDSSFGAVVFVCIIDSTTGDLVGPNLSLAPGQNVLFSSTSSSPGRLYTFLVDGIGQPPNEPLRLMIEPVDPSKDPVEVKLNPEAHTLPGRFALHVRDPELGAFPTNYQVEVALQNRSRSGLWRDTPHAVLISKVGTHPPGRKEWDASFFRRGASSSVRILTRKPSLSNYDFKVLVLD